MQHKPSLSLTQAQTARSNQSQIHNYTMKSKSRGRLNTQPTLEHVNEVIKTESYIKSLSRDRQKSENKQDQRSLSKSQRQKCKNKDNTYLQKVQMSYTDHQLKPFSLVKTSNPLNVNPKLLKPVLETAHLPHELHFKKQPNKPQQNSNQQHLTSNIRQFNKNSRNQSINQPIRSLRNSSKEYSISNMSTNNGGQRTLHNISILSNHNLGSSYSHSHKQSWQLNTYNIPDNQNQNKQDSANTHADQENIQENFLKAINQLDLNIPGSPSSGVKDNQICQTSAKNYHQRLLSEDSYNVCQSTEKYNPENILQKNQELTTITPGYMIIDLQQSNEKQQNLYNSRQNIVSQFNANDLQNSSYTQKQGEYQNNTHTFSEIKFQTVDFRTCADLLSSQNEKKRRREQCLSQSSDFMQNLVLKVKSAMSKSVNRTYQQQKENIDQETRIKSRDLLKRNSQNRLEILKSEMKKSLVEYKRSKERLIEQSKQQTPIKNQQELRKVSAFAQSVLTFSNKIDRLLEVQKTNNNRIPFQEQTNQQNQNVQQQVTKTMNNKVNCKIDRENLENYKLSAKRSFKNIKENKHQRDLTKGKMLLNTRLLEQKTRNAMPSYIKRTYIEMSSDSSNSSCSEDIKTKDIKQQNESINLPLSVEL